MSERQRVEATPRRLSECGDTVVERAPASRSHHAFPWQVQFGLLALIWGSSFLLIKYGLVVMSPLQLAGLRIVSGAAVLLMLAALRRTRWPREVSTWLHLAVTGLFLCTIPWTLFALAEQRISSALAGIGNASTPVFTVVLSMLFLRSDRVTARKLIAVVVGLIGVVVILQPWHAVGRPDPVGFAMVLGASSCYAIGWVYNRRYLGGRDLGGLAQPTVQLLLASAQMVVLYAVFSGLGLAPPVHQLGGTGHERLVGVPAILVLGIVGSGIATLLHYNVIRAAGPIIGTMVTYVIPVVAVLLGVVLLGERLQWPQLVGALLVMLAALVTQSWFLGRRKVAR